MRFCVAASTSSTVSNTIDPTAVLATMMLQMAARWQNKTEPKMMGDSFEGNRSRTRSEMSAFSSNIASAKKPMAVSRLPNRRVHMGASLSPKTGAMNSVIPIVRMSEGSNSQ